MTPTMASKAKRVTRSRTPIPKDLIFSIFIKATIVQTAITSLMNHYPFTSQYKGMLSKPIKPDIKSITLTILNTFTLKFL